MPGHLKQNRAAAYPRAVVFACDDGHFPFAMCAAERIRRVEPGAFDIVIAMPDISRVSAAHMEGPTRICEIDISALPDVPMVKDWISFGTYYRWALPAVFVDDYESLFYLDTDTYLRRPGIDALFGSIDRPVPLAAVTDFGGLLPRTPAKIERHSAKLRAMGGAQGQYFNAGVLLMQPAAFLDFDGPRRFAEAAIRNIDLMPIYKDQDQGAMNLAFADDIVPLSPLYNWRQRTWMNPRMIAHFDPLVLHFTGPAKPWNRNLNPFIESFEAEYTGYLAREFPAIKPKYPESEKDRKRLMPNYRLPWMNDLHAVLRRRRESKKLETVWNRHEEEKIALMRAAIDEAVLK